MATRYCYIVKGTEIDIVGVWSSREEAIEEAIHHVKEQGVLEWEVKEINDEYTVIKPIKYETFEEAIIERYVIR